jgi:hypothetical protein
MAEGPATPLRRIDDRRLDQLERKMDGVAVRVDEIRDWLIGEPESSALGRQLLQRAKANRSDIDKHDGRLDSLETWRSEWRGTWRFIASAGTVLGIIATAFSLAAYFGWHA